MLPNYQIHDIIKTCIICNQEYITIYPWQKYCINCAIIVNKTKRWEYHIKHHPRVGFKSRICINCSQEYTPTTSTQKYCQICGPPMQLEHARQKDRDDYAKKIKTGWREKHCRKCGYIYKPHSGFQYYCDVCKPIAKKERQRKAILKIKSKRRQLGYICLNSFFDGSVAHHVTKDEILYIPKEIHESIFHNIWTGKNMDEINFLAYKYFIGHGNNTISSE